MSKLRSAPLKIQFNKGYQAFRRGFTKNPYQRKDDVQSREWERGFNAAYFAELEYSSEQTRSA
jgi:hypothetical protein